MTDHQLFNKRLVDEVQKLQQQFSPGDLPFPKWLSDLADSDSRSHSPADELGLFPKRDSPPPSSPPQPPKRHNPFEAFMDELFSDDDG